MSAVFDALPGIEVPVAGLRAALARLWEGEVGADAEPLAEFRASQMNLILHLGLLATADDAARQFGVALRLAQRHPCRLIALVPVETGDSGGMRARVFSQCFVGRSRADRVCTEAVSLAYPPEARSWVGDHVSTLVEGDLPVYYWAHGFSSCRKLADHDALLRTARRFVFDSAIAPDDAPAFPWPQPDAVRDLAGARLLHVRQLLGQFFAGFPPERIGGGLAAATVRHGASVAAEARNLAGWATAALARCAAGTPLVAVEPAVGPGAAGMELELGYSDNRYCRWRADLEAGWAGFEADFGEGKIRHCAAVRLASPEAALGEAFFF